jgi:hypothetical protein
MLGFPEELSHEFGGFEDDIFFVADFDVCADFKDRHCE